jgi:sec-independent protein translocase protein TatA
MIGDIFQPTHLLFVLVVALLVLGPKRLPEAGRAVGGAIRDFRAAMSGEEHHLGEVSTQAPAPPPTTAVPVAPPVEPAAYVQPEWAEEVEREAHVPAEPAQATTELTHPAAQATTEPAHPAAEATTEPTHQTEQATTEPAHPAAQATTEQAHQTEQAEPTGQVDEVERPETVHPIG